MFAYCANNPVNCYDPYGYTFADVKQEYFDGGAGAVGVGAAGALVLYGAVTVGANLLQSLAYTVTEFLDQCALFFSQLTYERRIAKAEAEIEAKVTKSSKVRYWTATVNAEYIDIGRPLTFNQAVHEVQAGRSVFAVTWFEAKAVAVAAGGRSGYNNRSLTPEIDSGKENEPGYYYHYHTYNRSGGHVYFLFGEV